MASFNFERSAILKYNNEFYEANEVHITRLLAHYLQINPDIDNLMDMDLAVINEAEVLQKLKERLSNKNQY